mmetsp:Transcript_2467/g.5211  ORF Transcript_2467/g.5211 Transcript_2467/m.5211 type:complete len:226 (-) Transcript_2467:626-1303(-)
MKELFQLFYGTCIMDPKLHESFPKRQKTIASVLTLLRRSSSASKLHFTTVLGNICYFRGEDLLVGVHHAPIVPRDQGCQGDLRFQQGKVLANAIARSLGKGQESKRVDLLAALVSEKSFWSKFVRVFAPNVGISLNGVEINMNNGLAKLVLAKSSIWIGLVPRGGSRRIQSKGFPGNGVEKLALLEILVGGGFLGNDLFVVLPFHNRIDPVLPEVLQNFGAGLFE